MTAEDYNLEEYDTVVSTGEQITCGLLAIALNNIGIKARSYWHGKFHFLQMVILLKQTLVKLN